MKTILTLFVLTLVSFCYSQDYNREIAVGALDLFFKDKQTGLEHRFKYTLENSLNWEIHIETDKTLNQASQVNYLANIKKGSKDIILLSLMQISDLALYSTITGKCNFKYVLFKVIYHTADVEEISFYYKININDFADCRYSFAQVNCQNSLYSIQ